MIPRVEAIESGGAQTEVVARQRRGSRAHEKAHKKRSSRSGLGSPAGEGDSPVSEESGSASEYLSRAGHV